MKIFCRRILVDRPALLKMKGPLLIASNHPNSFLDAVILDILFDRPIWSLARGDVFKKPLYRKLLTAVKILPVYRFTEGPENLPENYKTFDACLGIFRKEGIVQIFSEGKCINEWHLRPLRKGTARLAFSSWENNIPLKVLPVGINYSSFRKFGKNIFIHFGDIITEQDFDNHGSDGKKFQAFNSVLLHQFHELVFDIEQADRQKQKQLLELPLPALGKILLILPAALGFLVHAPLYLPIKSFTWKRCNDNDHYDSVMAALLLFSYPLYLVAVAMLLLVFTHSWWVLLLFLLLPFTAWSYVMCKKQTG